MKKEVLKIACVWCGGCVSTVTISHVYSGRQGCVIVRWLVEKLQSETEWDDGVLTETKVAGRNTSVT